MVRLDPLGGAQFGAAAPRIGMNLFVGRFDHPAVDDSEARDLAADAYRQSGRADAGGRLPVEKRLDGPVFQAVIADHRQAAAGGEQAHRRVQAAPASSAYARPSTSSQVRAPTNLPCPMRWL